MIFLWRINVYLNVQFVKWIHVITFRRRLTHSSIFLVPATYHTIPSIIIIFRINIWNKSVDHILFENTNKFFADKIQGETMEQVENFIAIFWA